MFKQLITAAIMLVTISACNSDTKSAFQFSQDIVNLERSLIDDVGKTEDAVKQFISYEQYDSMAIVSARMESLIDDKLQQVKALKAPKVKEADNFKAASVRYFEFMKSMYTGYVKYGKAATQEERDVIMEELQEIVGNKNAAISDMQTAQRKFAEANNFKVEN